MPSLKFSVPHNNNIKTLKSLIQYINSGTTKNKIDEVFFSDSTIYGSGRIKDRINTKETTDLIHKNSLKANLVINSTCAGKDAYTPPKIDRLVNSIRKLHQTSAIDSLTIADPLLIQVIKNRIPKIHITASVLSEIDSVQRAMFFDKLGTDTIIPDRDINRDMKKLKEITEAIDADLKIMVNEGCMYRCPYRIFHFNYISHQSTGAKPQKEPDPFFKNCHMIDKIDPSQVFKSNWIRPEDTGKYHSITKSFKISGRTRKKEWILNTTKAYLEESYRGNLLDLTDSNLNAFKQHYNACIDNKSLNDFHRYVTSCSKNCHKCSYCTDQAKKFINYRTK